MKKIHTTSPRSAVSSDSDSFPVLFLKSPECQNKNPTVSLKKLNHRYKSFFAGAIWCHMISVETGNSIICTDLGIIAKKASSPGRLMVANHDKQLLNVGDRMRK